MSYYTQHFAQQQNPQQKTIRLLFVVALHAAVIFAIATAVTINNKPKDPPVINLNPIDETTSPPIQIAPSEPTEKPLQNTTVWNPPPIDPIGPQPTEPPEITGTGGTGIIATSSLTRATILRAPKPIYPSAAARLEESGTTGMKLLITEEGRVTNAQVIQSSGSSRLDDAAIKHVMRNWVFTPCTENGKAVSCEQNMRLKWQLEDAKR